MYRFDPDTGIYTIDDIYYTSIYYFWDSEGETFAFPNGFRMIASDAEAFVECVEGDWTPCKRDNCETENRFFPAEACKLVEITMDFPSCWNGDIDSPTHKTHVVYSDDECPGSHPKRLPTLSISIHIKNYDGGWHTWSDMSSEFHADYLSGWDEAVMQRMIDGCLEDVEECHQFITWKNGPTGDDSSRRKHRKLQRTRPLLPDTSKIASEAVDNISTLPRGLCEGTLLPAAMCSAKSESCSTSYDCCDPNQKLYCRKGECRKCRRRCRKDKHCCSGSCVEGQCLPAA